MKALAIIHKFLTVAIIAFAVLPFAGLLSYGHGLGDFFYAGTMVFVAILLLVVNYLTRRNRTPRRYLIILAVFLPVFCFFIFKATLGRGPEYRWNGHIFYGI